MKKAPPTRISKKALIVTISVIAFGIFLITPIVVNVLASIPNPYIKGDPNSVEATWISFWGSYLGGFLSALIGAGVSGLVAYFLIGREVEASRNSETVLAFSIKFNEDFQIVKKELIQSMVDMHTCLQNYHMNLTQSTEFKQELHNLLENFKALQIRLQQTLNTHVLLLQYVKEKSPYFNPNLLCDKYALWILQCNSLRTEYVKSLIENTPYDIVGEYNNNAIPKANDLRQFIVDTEYTFINVLFSAVKTEKKFSLPALEPITEKDYDKLMQTYLKEKQ